MSETSASFQAPKNQEERAQEEVIESWRNSWEYATPFHFPGESNNAQHLLTFWESG